jgi:hypothetical protein
MLDLVLLNVQARATNPTSHFYCGKVVNTQCSSVSQMDRAVHTCSVQVFSVYGRVFVHTWSVQVFFVHGQVFVHTWSVQVFSVYMARYLSIHGQYRCSLYMARYLSIHGQYRCSLYMARYLSIYGQYRCRHTADVNERLAFCLSLEWSRNHMERRP